MWSSTIYIPAEHARHFLEKGHKVYLIAAAQYSSGMWHHSSAHQLPGGLAALAEHVNIPDNIGVYCCYAFSCCY